MISGIYAHRGFHDKPNGIPENSMIAFRRAIERGFGAELDVHLLKDGGLAVFHDSDLKRCTGLKGVIENLTLPEAMKIKLEGTEETIPSFDQVLELFEGRAALIIELKTYKGNHKELAQAVCERLDRYNGEFCIESFDPRAIKDVRELRPDIIRGQLSQDFMKRPEGLPWYQRILLTNLFLNFMTKPDFIAYRFEDRDNFRNRECIKNGIQEVCWTISNKQGFDTVLKDGGIPIFERFDPEE